jgi:hypothetical protein
VSPAFIKGFRVIKQKCLFLTTAARDCTVAGRLNYGGQKGIAQHRYQTYKSATQQAINSSNIAQYIKKQKHKYHDKKISKCRGIAFLLSCNSARQITYTVGQRAAIDSTKGLKDFYHDYFLLVLPFPPGALKTDEAGLVLQHFNSITPRML